MTRVRLPLISLALGLAAAGCAQQTPQVALAPEPPAQKAVTPMQEAGAAVDNRIVVAFAPGSDRLSPDAGKQLDIAARLFRDVRPVTMFSTGFSDASGGSEYDNLLLAARRARTVKIALVARGIPANQVQLRSLGQSDPVERSDPDAAANRRVTVTWDIM